MADYCIKQDRQYYLVSSFDGHKEPANQYTVSDGPRFYCSCPGFWKNPGPGHKHIALVRAWKAAGSPWLAVLTMDKDQTIHIHNQHLLGDVP